MTRSRLAFIRAIPSVSISAGLRYSINLLSGTNWIATPNPKAKDQALAKKCAASDPVADHLNALE